jgi:galactan 5-O-arabinofuranosyltransferase
MLIDSHQGLVTRADRPAEAVRDPLPDRGRVLSFCGEVAAVLIVASAVSVLVQFVVNRLPIPRQSNVPTALTWSAVFVLGCVTVALLWRRWSRPKTVAAWILPAALTSTVQALLLFGTPFYLNGMSGDQFFRMQYLQRLTVSPSLTDGNYAGLPPYYPAGWFWLGGRFANLVGDPAWSAYKPFAILTIAVMSSLSFALWSLIVSRRRAFAVATVFALAGTVLGPYEPYSWVAMTFIPPIAVLAWRLFRSIADRRGVIDLGPATVLIGVGISIAAATYTLVFGFEVLLVVVLAVAAGRTAMRGLALPLVARLVLIGIAALPITLLVWGPYLYSAIRDPSAGNAAAQFFPLDMATLDTPMLSPTITGAICMVGLVWIILAWRRSTIAQAFGITVLACVGWQFLSTLALADDTTLLPSHIAKVGEIVLWCACAFGLIDLVVLVPDKWRGVRTLVPVLAVLVTVALTQTPSASVQGLLGGAFAPPDKYNDQLIQTIARLSGRLPQNDVLLTNDYPLLDFQPYFSFQTNKEQYANPPALYPERNQELVRWSQASTAAELWSDLTSSTFRTPNVFVFSRDAQGNYPFGIVTTDFPFDNRTHTITFPARLFASAHFTSREVGPYTVIVR